ncbi:MAG: type II toxin-antitoxin system RelE/ParE family toxin [Methylococcales bacterium]
MKISKKKFAFINEAAEREYRDLPDKIQDAFGKDLRRIQFDEEPKLPTTYLDSIGAGVIELRKNGSPAFRCIYVAKYENLVVVLHSFSKTTNAIDRQAMKVAEQRFKELLAELKKIH